MTIETVIDVGEVIKALSHPVRRRILNKMKDPERNFPGQEHPYDFGVCAGKVEAACSLSQSTVSAHLAVLHHARLLTAKKIGQWVFYKRNEAAIAAFLAFMEQSL